MNGFRIRTFVALAFALAMVPASLAAQQQPAPAPQPTPEVQGWITEIQQIEQRLGPIQARAMEDPALLEAHTELNAAVLAALTQGNPAVQSDLQRVETIQPELQAAQQAGDQEQMQRLMTEAQQLQQRLMEAQARVIQSPEIATRVQAFETRLHARMTEIDPEAEALLQRFRTLQTQILQAMQQP